MDNPTPLRVIHRPEHVQALRNALKHITDHPEQWNQGEFCGTACCLYGRVLLQAGHVYTGWGSWQNDHRAAVTDVVVTAEQLIGLAASQLTPEQRHLLDGIEGEYEGPLWAAGHALSTLWEYASALTGGEIKVPEEIRDFTHPAYAFIHGL